MEAVRKQRASKREGRKEKLNVMRVKPTDRKLENERMVDRDILRMRERGREEKKKERERERGRDRQTVRDRQTNREREIGRQTDRQIVLFTEKGAFQKR